MKRIVIALSITILAVAAFAGEPQRKMFIHNMQAENNELAIALGLSTDQKVQWDAIHQQLEATSKPIFEQISAGEQQLRTLAEASNPDATAVGQAYLAIGALKKQIKAAHDSAHQRIAAILTPDQNAKLDALHAEMEHGPMMRMHHPDGPGRD
jgi:Spy/CpxP family protein refolding chaperone